ncbi:copper chaperone PCu(A)C [Phenylobacterium sp. LjRoot219]|uniref:copper chaperone PCu(A)C n=1 Tax=Phenylobacterium sp. LjRoot219 TaxID=3342283 RepID=UPI003ECE0825
MKAALAAAALFAAAAAPAVAASPVLLEAVQPWSRPAAAGGNGAGYLTLVNRGKADALVGAESPVAKKVEMHTSSMSGGVMKMSQEQRVPLPAGGQVSFAPGGRHLMLLGLKRPLKTGERVPATLRFASGQQLKVDFVVSPAAPSGAHQGHDMHHMH